MKEMKTVRSGEKKAEKQLQEQRKGRTDETRGRRLCSTKACASRKLRGGIMCAEVSQPLQNMHVATNLNELRLVQWAYLNLLMLDSLPVVPATCISDADIIVLILRGGRVWRSFGGQSVGGLTTSYLLQLRVLNPYHI